MSGTMISLMWLSAPQILGLATAVASEHVAEAVNAHTAPYLCRQKRAHSFTPFRWRCRSARRRLGSAPTLGLHFGRRLRVIPKHQSRSVLDALYCHITVGVGRPHVSHSPACPTSATRGANPQVLIARKSNGIPAPVQSHFLARRWSAGSQLSPSAPALGKSRPASRHDAEVAIDQVASGQACITPVIAGVQRRGGPGE